MTLIHLEPGFQGHQSFPLSIVRNRAKYTAQSAYFLNRDTTDKIIVYDRNTENECLLDVQQICITWKNIPEVQVCHSSVVNK